MYRKRGEARALLQDFFNTNSVPTQFWDLCPGLVLAHKCTAYIPICAIQFYFLLYKITVYFFECPEFHWESPCLFQQFLGVEMNKVRVSMHFVSSFSLGFSKTQTGSANGYVIVPLLRLWQPLACHLLLANFTWVKRVSIWRSVQPHVCAVRLSISMAFTKSDFELDFIIVSIWCRDGFPPIHNSCKDIHIFVKFLHYFALDFIPPNLNTIIIYTCGRKGACVWLIPHTNSCLQVRREYKRSSYVFIEGFPDHILE